MPLTPIRAPELASSLEARLAGGDAVIALDADGTLWSGDVGFDLFDAAIAGRRLLAAALPALRAEAERLGLHASGEARGEAAGDASGDASRLAARLDAAFRAGTLDEERAYAMMAWCFAGRTPAEMDALADEVLAAVDLPARVQPETAAILAWARARGVPAWIVSASPRAVVDRAVARLGLPVERVLAMSPDVVGGRLAARVVPPLTYAEGKARAIAEAIARHRPGARLLAAFGDGSFDLPMLRAAEVAVAVRPKDALRAALADLPGAVELVA